MHGISTKAVGKIENSCKFNYGSKLQNDELEDGTGLEIYDTKYRGLDPQLGRWWQIDPHAELHLSTSPYTYVLNNPLLYNDPFGLDTVKVFGDGKHKIKIRQGDVLAWDIGNKISYYTFDPSNQNAVDGFVGAGIQDEELMDNVTVTAPAKQKDSPSYGLPWSTAASTGLAVGSQVMHNKSGWYSFSQNKFYSPRFYGNQYTSGGQKAAKALAVKAVRVGYGLSAWNAYDINRQYLNGDIGKGRMLVEQGSNAISSLGIVGAAWGVGWELGRGVTSIPWYRANIRPVIQDGLGIPRDEYLKTSWVDRMGKD